MSRKPSPTSSTLVIRICRSGLAAAAAAYLTLLVVAVGKFTDHRDTFHALSVLAYATLSALLILKLKRKSNGRRSAARV